MSATSGQLGATRRQREESRRTLRLILCLTAGFMVVEFVTGFLTNSLALLSDAGHMLTDVAALSISLFALWVASRPANARKSFGYHRTEILAALVNGVAVVVIAVMIVWEAIHRIGDPPPVKGGPMIVVAFLGLLVNLFAAWRLYRHAHGHGHGHSHGNLNIRGAFLHVLGDALGSVGAIVAGVLILAFDFRLADPLISFLVAGLILMAALRLIRRSVDILLEAAPAHLNLGEIETALTEVDGVCGVHDLHVWTITSGFESLTAHLILEAGARHQQVLEAAHEMLTERFGLDHSTLQPEETGLHPCGDPARTEDGESPPGTVAG